MCVCVPWWLTCSPTCARVHNLPSLLPATAAGATHLRLRPWEGRRLRLTFPVCLPDPTTPAHCTLDVLEAFDCRVACFGLFLVGRRACASLLTLDRLCKHTFVVVVVHF